MLLLIRSLSFGTEEYEEEDEDEDEEEEADEADTGDNGDVASLLAVLVACDGINGDDEDSGGIIIIIDISIVLDMEHEEEDVLSPNELF